VASRYRGSLSGWVRVTRYSSLPRGQAAVIPAVCKGLRKPSAATTNVASGIGKRCTFLTRLGPRVVFHTGGFAIGADITPSNESGIPTSDWKNRRVNTTALPEAMTTSLLQRARNWLARD